MLFVLQQQSSHKLGRLFVHLLRIALAGVFLISAAAKVLHWNFGVPGKICTS